MRVLRKRRLASIVALCAVSAVIAIWVAWTYLPRALGLCPYPVDPRSYEQHGCAVFDVGSVTTFDQALAYYHVPMPADARGVRFYLDSGAFNGGDAFFLSFAASPTEVAAFLAKLDVTKSGLTAEALWNVSSQGHDVASIPWHFDSSKVLRLQLQREP